MKIIKEDIANLERAIENDKVNVVGSMPLVMADAAVESEKKQNEISKEMEEHDKETKVELNKVIGAEKQPVPDLPVKAKSVLDESLFEDFDDEDDDYEISLPVVYEQGEFDRDVKKDIIEVDCDIDDVVRYETTDDFDYFVLTFKDGSKKAWFIHNGMYIPDDNFQECLHEDTKEDDFYVSLERVSDDFDMLLDKMKDFKYLYQIIEEEEAATLNDASEILQQMRGRYQYIDADDEPLNEDTKEDAYYDALDIPKGPDRKKVKEQRRQEYLRKHSLNDRAKEWKDSKGKDDSEEEEDIFTKINDELSPYDMEEVKLWTKFPEIKASKRYNIDDISTDYDGNIVVHAPSKDAFDFANKVAKAYDVKITEPKEFRGSYSVKILPSEVE